MCLTIKENAWLTKMSSYKHIVYVHVYLRTYFGIHDQNCTEVVLIANATVKYMYVHTYEVYVHLRSYLVFVVKYVIYSQNFLACIPSSHQAMSYQTLSHS